MLTDFFIADDIAVTARRTGFVQRTSKLTGKLLLALVTCGAWSDAKTTLAPWAAKAAPLSQPVDISPEALHQRMHTKASALLQDMRQQALAKRQSLDHGWDDGLLPACTNVYIADSPGVARPDALHTTCPGAGGRAGQAGAKIHAVWDYTSRRLGHLALTPWHIPDQRYVDTVVALAQQGVLCLFALGYLKVNAFAQMVTAGAYCCGRLKHPTHLYETVAGRVGPVKLAEFLATVEPSLLLLEKAIRLGATEHVASRLIAVRMPEAVVQARRRSARKNAKKKGYTPLHAHLTLMAWNLLLTHVPPTLWKTATVLQVYPLRWHIARMVKSWKSDRHWAAMTTKTEDPTLCYLSGRRLLMRLTYALCPQRRAQLWMQQKRELSLRKLMRHRQAFAASWLQAIFQSEFGLRRVLARVCATATRLAAKASRTRRTTAQILQDSLCQQHESVAFAEAVNA